MMAATQVKLNHEATITVAFLDYTGTNDPGDAVDPNSVDVYIIQDGTTLVTDTPTKLSVGEYSYAHTFTTLGDFIVRFTGHFTDDSATPSTTYDVDIEEEITVVADFTDEKKLGQTVEFSFATGISPLHLDPEDIKHAFPEADLIEIAELIQKFSLEVNRILDNETPLPQLAYDFIRESVLCSLSSIYSAFETAGGSITLGDLSVSSARRYTGPVNRGNATNSCERAFILRQELLRSVQGSKAVVKGYRSGAKTLPDRSIKHRVRGDL